MRSLHELVRVVPGGDMYKTTGCYLMSPAAEEKMDVVELISAEQKLKQR